MINGGKVVFLLQNIEGEGPGLLEEILKKHQIAFDKCSASDSTIYPDPSDYAAVFVFGGPDSANDDTLKMKKELDFVKGCVENEIPYLGICLGHQLLLKSAGADVYKNPVKEIGFKNNGKYYVANLTEDGTFDVLFNRLRNHFPVFQLHGETASLPDNAVLLATGNYCKNQAARVGKNAYGLQFHVELTEEMLMRWLCEAEDLKKMDSRQILADYKAIRVNYTFNGGLILENFLRIAQLIK